MIPEVVSPSASNAEKRMFEIIRDAPGTHECICFHSLHVANHPSKRRGEVDFVFLSRQGVFFLEAKGGRIKRLRGNWYTVDSDDKRHPLHESPFDQAAGGMFALSKQIKTRFHGKPQAQALMGYGVLFPDTVFDDESPEWDSQSVYDMRDTALPFTSYLKRLTAAARAADPREQVGQLTPDAIKELANYFRGDITTSPSVDRVLDVVGDQLNRLTAKQLKVRSVLRRHQRAIIEGGAGTGKTLLAIDAARRMARTGDRVLFLCFNQLLSRRLASRLSGEEFDGELIVRTMHDHFATVYQGTEGQAEIEKAFEKAKKKKGKRERKQAESRVFKELFPLHAGLVASERPDERFDALVIDEAQDILTNANLDALDLMLRGGLKEGRWYVFLDARDQAAVYDNMESEAFDRLAAGNVRDVLSTNCRNTVQIAEQTALMSALQEPVDARVNGKSVSTRKYKDDSEKLRHLESIVSELRADGVSPGRVSVLFINRPKQGTAELRTLDELGLRELTEQEVPKLGTEALDSITWSTVSGFKGLENDIVLLVGVKDIEDRWHRGVAYVGMSRARVRLCLVIREDCEAKRKEREREWRAKHISDIEILL